MDRVAASVLSGLSRMAGSARQTISNITHHKHSHKADGHQHHADGHHDHHHHAHGCKHDGACNCHSTVKQQTTQAKGCDCGHCHDHGGHHDHKPHTHPQEGVGDPLHGHSPDQGVCPCCPDHGHDHHHDAHNKPTDKPDPHTAPKDQSQHNTPTTVLNGDSVPTGADPTKSGPTLRPDSSGLQPGPSLLPSETLPVLDKAQAIISDIPGIPKEQVPTILREISSLSPAALVILDKSENVTPQLLSQLGFSKPAAQAIRALSESGINLAELQASSAKANNTSSQPQSSRAHTTQVSPTATSATPAPAALATVTHSHPTVQNFHVLLQALPSPVSPTQVFQLSQLPAPQRAQVLPHLGIPSQVTASLNQQLPQLSQAQWANVQLLGAMIGQAPSSQALHALAQALQLPLHSVEKLTTALQKFLNLDQASQLAVLTQLNSSSPQGIEGLAGLSKQDIAAIAQLLSALSKLPNEKMEQLLAALKMAGHDVSEQLVAMQAAGAEDTKKQQNAKQDNINAMLRLNKKKGDLAGALTRVLFTEDNELLLQSDWDDQWGAVRRSRDKQKQKEEQKKRDRQKKTAKRLQAVK